MNEKLIETLKAEMLRELRRMRRDLAVVQTRCLAVGAGIGNHGDRDEDLRIGFERTAQRLEDFESELHEIRYIPPSR